MAIASRKQPPNSVFGRALLDHGVFTPEHERKRHSAQGLALLAGKWLARLERCGLAVRGTDGWRVADKRRMDRRAVREA